MSAYTKPLPQMTPEMRPFWETARRHQLVVQRCRSCATPRFPARDICSRCLSREAEWTPVVGRGVVFSWATMHQVYHPGFADEVPYAVLVVEMEEGPRLVGNLRDLAPAELALDLPVEVVLEPVAENVALTHFRPA